MGEALPFAKEVAAKEGIEAPSLTTGTEHSQVEELASARARPPETVSVHSGPLLGVGILFSPNATGLEITGFHKDSSAVKSKLKVGDIITCAGDSLLIGMSVSEALGAMSGPANTTVEIVAFRLVNGTKKERVTDVFEYDVDDSNVSSGSSRMEKDIVESQKKRHQDAAQRQSVAIAKAKAETETRARLGMLR